MKTIKRKISFSWGEAKHKDRKWVFDQFSKWVYVPSVIIIMLVLGFVEIPAMYSLTGYWIPTVLGIIFIEGICQMMFFFAFFMVVLGLASKAKSYYVISSIFFLVSIGVFWMSRSMSEQGKQIMVEQYSSIVDSVAYDTISFALVNQSIAVSKKSGIDSINAVYDKRLAKESRHLYSKKKRQPDQLPNEKYGLSNINQRIDHYKGKKLKWEKKAYKLLSHDLEILQGDLRRIEERINIDRLAAISEYEKPYNAKQGANNDDMAEYIKTVDKKNGDLTKKSDRSKDSWNMFGSWVIIILLVVSVFLHGIHVMGPYWAGCSLDFEVISEGSIKELGKIRKRAEKANAYNVEAKKLTEQYGGVISVDRITIETREKEQETPNENTHLQTGEILHENVRKINPSIPKQNRLETPMKRTRYGKKDIVKMAVLKYPMLDGGDIERWYDSLYQSSNTASTIRRNFDDKNKQLKKQDVSKMSSEQKRIHYTRCCKIDMGSAILSNEGYNCYVKKNGKYCARKRKDEDRIINEFSLLKGIA